MLIKKAIWKVESLAAEIIALETMQNLVSGLRELLGITEALEAGK
jgi:hypothetical protein